MKEVLRQNLKSIFESEWNEKKIWECIRDNELSYTPAFIGENYEKAKIKIMYVGHAVNGWGEMETEKCTTIENTLDVALSQTGGLDTLVNQAGYHYVTRNGKDRVYRHINSNFWRLIKHILEYQGKSDFPTTEETWYQDSKSWQKSFIWTNLYCLAPRAGGNPDTKLMKPFMNQYKEMLRAQIEEYKPNIVICCPLSGFFAPWKREPNFAQLLDEFEDYKNNNTIIQRGKFKETEVIVCRRPDSRGKSREQVQKMAKDVSEYINLFLIDTIQ